LFIFIFFFFQAEDGIRDYKVTGVQTCALPISSAVIGLAGGEPRLYPDRVPGLVRIGKNFCKEACDASSPRSRTSSGDSSNRIPVVLSGTLPPEGGKLRFCCLQHEFAVLAGSGGRLGRLLQAIGCQSRARGPGELLR